MSKTRRNYTEDFYNEEEYTFAVSDYQHHRKEKRLSKALRTKDLEDLINLEDDEN